MTDRLNALTVVLSQDVRDDDAQKIIEAIMQMRGVLSVTGNVVTISDHVAEMRANEKVRGIIYGVLQEFNK